MAIHRIERRLATALPVVWGGTLLELGGGAVGAILGGLTGVAWGWLAGLCVEGLVMSRDVIRGLRPDERGTPRRSRQARSWSRSRPWTRPHSSGPNRRGIRQLSERSALAASRRSGSGPGAGRNASRSGSTARAKTR